jgi:hypothetical protein
MKTHHYLAATLLGLAITSLCLANEIFGKAAIYDIGTPENRFVTACPGVIVTLENEKFGKFKAVSSANGNFRFHNLPPGLYRVRAELAGFRFIAIENHSPHQEVLLEICCGKRIRIGIRLLQTSAYSIEWVTGTVAVKNKIDMRPAHSFCFRQHTTAKRH